MNKDELREYRKLYADFNKDRKESVYFIPANMLNKKLQTLFIPIILLYKYNIGLEYNFSLN